MDEGPEWFAQKQFGYGAGLPIAWQGWAVLVAYLGIAFATSRFVSSPLAILGIMVPATAALLVVTAKTTRGGWQWRWGRKGRD